MSSHDDLPPALSAMWRAVKRGYKAEPRLLVVAFGLSLLAALPDALIALLLKILVGGVQSGSRSVVLLAALAVATATVGTWFIRVFSDRIQRRFRDRLTVALESHVAQVAGNRRHDRTPRTPAFSQSTRRVAQPSFCARSHVHVALFNVWLDLAAGGDARPPGFDSPGACAACRFRTADGDCGELAARGGARCRRAGCRVAVDWRGICSTSPPRRRQARRYG